ncbi:hypothetical protein BDB00DRAFT_795301 [Zychaea mexicana]|uniref:uncharacterized protein n=1 Tax=Zychaea mexicana TaxID=64656 RepID=UPI0022FE946D|nr:uncharacterized protein BDB00DRAFT_795301 [Zychaea mexicana]KAI9499722.1 hypothetical protein BDB00DRAFT_795301 [Zychaea mexicana]
MSSAQLGSSDDKLQQALLETIRQNGRLLDELQAARRREEQLIDKCFQLEENLLQYVLGDEKRSQLLKALIVDQNDKDEHLKETLQQGSVVLQQNNRNHHATTTAATSVSSAQDTDQDTEEWVQWQRVPHYEVVVNSKVVSEAFVANNASVSFIREDVVRRAGLKPNKLNPPARFRLLGSVQPVVVAETVVVPMRIGDYRGQCPMFVYQHIRSEIILGASWLQSERVYWNVDFMLIGPKKIRVDPKPPVMVKKSDPRATMVDGPVIIERLN